MVDLAQAFKQVKGLPDEALQDELANPTGLLPGFIVLGEMRDRKALRNSTAVPTEPAKAKSLVSDFVGKGMQPYVAPPRQPAQGIGSLPVQAQGYASGGIVSLGGRYHNNVDPRLRQYLEAAAQGFNYPVEFISGYREGDPRFHGRSQAIDVQLMDPLTGKAMANYQDPQHFSAYQQYANRVYQSAAQADPGFANQLRWGGYFGGGKGKYGALDLMHFDTGGDKVGMAGGSWSGGLNPEQAKLWGLQPGGGVGQATVAYAPPSMSSRRDAIASIESRGSGDYSALGPQLKSGDRAYGRYQVMGSNIPEWTKKTFGQSMSKEDFLANPSAQDAVFDKIFGGYVDQYGDQGAASMWFTGRPSAPNATDVLGTSGSEYVNKYMAALGQGASVAPVAIAAAPTTPTPPISPDDPINAFGDFMTLASLFGGQQQQQAPAPSPGPAPKRMLTPEEEQRQQELFYPEIRRGLYG